MSRAERIAKQLGMSQGAANNKLRKMLLFTLVQQTNQDNCFKCGNKIETVEEFSVEHKLPWEGRDSDLFWNLDNIAFSHLQCNKPHIYHNPNARRICVDGKYCCARCGEWKNPQDFVVQNTKFSGRASHCKSCKYTSDTRKNHSKQYNYGK